MVFFSHHDFRMHFYDRAVIFSELDDFYGQAEGHFLMQILETLFADDFAAQFSRRAESVEVGFIKRSIRGGKFVVNILNDEFAQSISFMQSRSLNDRYV